MAWLCSYIERTGIAHKIGGAQHPVQRRPDLMAHGSQELGLRLIGGLRLASAHRPTPAWLRFSARVRCSTCASSLRVEVAQCRFGHTKRLLRLDLLGQIDVNAIPGAAPTLCHQTMGRHA